MGTQGLIALVRRGEVVRKIVVGCSGMNVPRLARKLRAKQTDDPETLLKMAFAEDVGCDDCRVIQVTATTFALPDGAEFEQEGKDFERWRDKFSDPKFNPRWDNGTAAYSEIVILD